MAAIAPRTIEQIVADHTPIIAQILDRPAPTNVTAAEFIALVGEAAAFTDRLFGSYMEAANDELETVVAYLNDALACADDNPARQVFLAASDKRLNALDSAEFLY